MDLAASCRRLFESHRREDFGGVFHVSSPGGANVLSSWASAHHALALRHLELGLARRELETLYRANRLESGLVSRERLLDGATPSSSLAPVLGEHGCSRLIEPPLAAFAAACVATQIGDDARELLACATDELDAIWSERLPPDTSLPVILHPLESATCGSPLYDSLVDADELDEWLGDLASIGRSAAACQFDPARALRAGHPFVVEDPVFCGWFLVALEEVAAAWGRLGDSRHESKLKIRAQMIAEAISERLWCEEQLLYVGYDRRREEALRAVTAGGIVPAASRKLLEEGTAKRAIESPPAERLAALGGAGDLVQPGHPRPPRCTCLRDPVAWQRGPAGDALLGPPGAGPSAARPRRARGAHPARGVHRSARLPGGLRSGDRRRARCRRGGGPHACGDRARDEGWRGGLIPEG
jgi:hypothetical protein